MTNHLKTPQVEGLNRFALKVINDQIQLTGKALPARVEKIVTPAAIVTVSFQVTSPYTLPQVDVPIATWRYMRAPVRVGELGIVRPIDTQLGGISGLGTGVADLSPPANLGALVFEPVGNQNWPDVRLGALDIWGPNGVDIHNLENDCTISLTDNRVDITAPTAISFTVGSHTIVINSSGVIIDGKNFLLHTHGGVTTGGGTSGPVT